MRKRWFLVGMIFLLLSVLTVGCGVSEEVHNAVAAERDAVQAQVNTLKAEIAALQSELINAQAQTTSLQGDLSKALAQTASVQGQLDTAKSELQSTRNELDATKSELLLVESQLSAAQSTIEAQDQTMTKAKTFAEVISTLFVPALKGEPVDEFELALQWLASIQALEDPEADRLANAIITSGGGEQEFTDFYLYILETLPKILN